MSAASSRSPSVWPLPPSYRQEDRIAACFFGDGAVNQGTFHESLNWARLWELPVLFICENNFYGIGTEVHRSSALASIHKRTCGYDIPSEKVDGMDVIAVYKAVKYAAEKVRETGRPYFIEAITYRFRGHSMADPAKYRSAAEHEVWKARDPLPDFAKRLIEEGIADQRATGRRFWPDAVLWCRKRCSLPKNRPGRKMRRCGMTSMSEMTYRDALNLALKEEMRRDPSVVVWGEDVALYEGSFKVTRGCWPNSARSGSRIPPSRKTPSSASRSARPWGDCGRWPN